MIRKLMRLLAFFALCAVAVTALMYAITPEKRTNDTPPAPTTPGLVKIVKPIDLSGKWESVESKAGTKFVTEIKNNTVHIQMYANDGYTGLWYGTFDILQPGANTMVSKYIDDPDHFVLSSAETKEFLYQGDSLIFDFSMMGTVTTIEMKRV